jgi:hypothetical protein
LGTPSGRGLTTNQRTWKLPFRGPLALPGSSVAKDPENAGSCSCRNPPFSPISTARLLIASISTCWLGARHSMQRVSSFHLARHRKIGMSGGLLTFCGRPGSRLILTGSSDCNTRRLTFGCRPLDARGRLAAWSAGAKAHIPLVWGFLCQGSITPFLSSFVIPFFCSTRAASILPSRPHISIAVARS